MATICLVAVLNARLVEDFTYDMQFSERNDWLTRVGSASVSSRLDTVRSIPVLAPTDMKTQYTEFWSDFEVARKPSGFSKFLSLNTSFSGLALFAWASSLAKRYFSDPFSSLPGLWPTRWLQYT